MDAERLEERRQGIGGSDLAAALGLSPWKRPFELYQEKLGLANPEPENSEAIHFGNVLEDVVADEFSRRTRLKVRRSHQHLTHPDPDFEFLKANIDRSVVGRPFGVKCGLECKTADKWAAKPDQWGAGAVFEWDEDDNLIIAEHDDQVPDWYRLQCVHYMGVTGADFWFLAVLIGGNDFRIYTIWRDMDLERVAFRKAAKFWREHVLTQVPPPPTSVVDVEMMYSLDDGRSVYATPEIVACWAQIKERTAQLKALEVELDGQTIGKTRIGGLKNQLREFIGPASEVLLSEEDKPLATWKAPKPSRGFDQEAFKKAHPKLYREFTRETQPFRRLLIK